MRAIVLAGHHLKGIAARPALVAAAVLLAAGLAVATGLVLHDLPDATLAAAGIFWPVLVFTAIHATGRGLALDVEGGGHLGQLLLPVSRTTLVLARTTANAIATMGLAATVLLGLRAILPPGTRVLDPAMLAVAALACIGLATVSTIAAHAAQATTAHDLVGPVLAVPLVMPVLIGGIHGSIAALDGGLAAATSNITFLTGYDIVLIGVTALIADHLVGTP